MHSHGQAAIWWVRRDLRLADNPALRSAIDDGEAVLPLFVLDPALMASAGQARRAWLIAALHVLDRDLRDTGGHGVSVVGGAPAAVVPSWQRPSTLNGHVTADFSPYGRSRDNRVAQALGVYDIELSRTGSPYAVAPGTLKSDSGRPFQLFSLVPSRLDGARSPRAGSSGTRKRGAVAAG